MHVPWWSTRTDPIPSSHLFRLTCFPILWAEPFNRMNQIIRKRDFLWPFYVATITLFSCYHLFHFNNINDIVSLKFIKFNMSVQCYAERINKIQSPAPPNVQTQLDNVMTLARWGLEYHNPPSFSCFLSGESSKIDGS